MNNPPTNETLRTYIAKTYYALRWGMAGIAFLLPLFLFVAGPLTGSGPQPDSISGYYHTPLRDVFVGALVTTGTFLILYKIFTPLENWLLNVAGVGAILVAMLPCAVPGGRPPAEFTYPAGHAVFAIITFLCMGLTAIFCAPLTVGLLPPGKQKLFRATYRTIGVLMFLLPALTGLFDAAGWVNLFWVETAGLWVFGAYWIVKTIEFGITGREREVITGAPGGTPLSPSLG
jgi:hypothetical protein